MARLPAPGGDPGLWGTILNDFLSQSHATDGTLKPTTVTTQAIAPSAVTAPKLSSGSGLSGQVLSTTGTDLTWQSLSKASVGLSNVDNISDANKPISAATSAALADKAPLSSPTFTGTVSVPTPSTPSAAVTKSYVDTSISNISVADATTTTKGVIRLSGDISGTADAPTVPGLATKTSVTGGGGETYYDAGNSGPATAVNLLNGNVQRVTLTSNTTLSLTAVSPGSYRGLLLYIFQDATGSRTITWPNSVSWGAAGAPVLTTTPNKMDMVHISTVDGGTTWYGVPGAQGF